MLNTQVLFKDACFVIAVNVMKYCLILDFEWTSIEWDNVIYIAIVREMDIFLIWLNLKNIRVIKPIIYYSMQVIEWLSIESY